MPENVPKEMVVAFKDRRSLEGMVKQFAPEGVWIEGGLVEEGEEIKKCAEGGWIGPGGVVIWTEEGGKGRLEDFVGGWKAVSRRKVAIVEGGEVERVWKDRVGE